MAQLQRNESTITEEGTGLFKKKSTGLYVSSWVQFDSWTVDSSYWPRTIRGPCAV